MRRKTYTDEALSNGWTLTRWDMRTWTEYTVTQTCPQGFAAQSPAGPVMRRSSSRKRDALAFFEANRDNVPRCPHCIAGTAHPADPVGIGKSKA